MISVVITVRNRPEYLAECVAALRAQRFPAAAFEIIIVDDASDDGRTPAVVAQLQAANHGGPRIRTILLDRRLGPGGARNKGNAVAEGDVIVVQDSDDVSLPDRLTAVRSFFDANPAVDVFWSGAWACDREGSIIRQQHACLSQWEGLTVHQDIWHPTMAYRKSVLSGTNGRDSVAYPEDPADVDYAFLLAARAAGCRPGCLDVPLVKYRMHPGQISRAQARVQHELAARNQRRFAAADAAREGKRRQNVNFKRKGDAK